MTSCDTHDSIEKTCYVFTRAFICIRVNGNGECHAEVFVSVAIFEYEYNINTDTDTDADCDTDCDNQAAFRHSNLWIYKRPPPKAGQPSAAASLHHAIILTYSIQFVCVELSQANVPGPA